MAGSPVIPRNRRAIGAARATPPEILPWFATLTGRIAQPQPSSIFLLPPTLSRREMHNQRTVITGVGALSPNGVGRENYFAALKQGRSGVRAITQFDASKLPSRVAGEVDFDPALWVDVKNMKHVSRVVPMVIAATDEALKDAKLDPS